MVSNKELITGGRSFSASASTPAERMPPSNSPTAHPNCTSTQKRRSAACICPGVMVYCKKEILPQSRRKEELCKNTVCVWDWMWTTFCMTATPMLWRGCAGRRRSTRPLPFMILTAGGKTGSVTDARLRYFSDPTFVAAQPGRFFFLILPFSVG